MDFMVVLGRCEWKGILRESGILFPSPYFFETGSLSRDNPGFPGTLYIDQAGLEVIEIHLLCLLLGLKESATRKLGLPFPLWLLTCTMKVENLKGSTLF